VTYLKFDSSVHFQKNIYRVFLSSGTANCIKVSQVVLHIWGNYLLPLVSLNKTFIVKTFYCCVDCCAAVERQYDQKFSVHFAPSRDTI
jgi:hypothetical protein